MKVSVIVAGRNYAKYVRAAVSSAVRQTQSVHDVTYVDDGSTDDSVQIIKDAFPQVKVFPRSWQGACAARNFGVANTTGEYVLHLDADDILPEFYIERMLQCIGDHDFCYTNAQAFDNGWNHWWPALYYDLKQLWFGNYINTSTLIRRDKFLRWRETIGTVWDWDYFLRAGLAGQRGIWCKDNYLLYRHHDTSHSRSSEEKLDRSQVKWLYKTQVCPIQISCILSGRLLRLLPRWCKAIKRNIEFFNARLRATKPYGKFGGYNPIETRLVVLYTGPQGERSYVNKTLAKYFKHFDLLSDETSFTWDTEVERRDLVASHMAKWCTRLMHHDNGNHYVWFVEDDIIPPEHGLFNLFKANVPIAAGVYRNRHVPDTLVAHMWPLRDFNDPPTKDVWIDLCGTGCTLAFKPHTHWNFPSHFEGVPAHDWAWAMQHKEPRVLLVNGVNCRHYTDTENYV